MLAQYQGDTNILLQNPSAPTALYALPNVTRWINIARGQLAGEGECVRAFGTVSTIAGQRAYDFSALNIGNATTTGRQGTIHVRAINVTTGDGQRQLVSRPWQWFNYYNVANPVPQPGPPQEWSEFAQGSAGSGTGSGASGSFYIDPPPDDVYVLNCDCVCYPVTLVDDTTVEAIPYLWTDAVPFFAAYYALLSSQTSAREAYADRMLARYNMFVERARQAANPSVLRWQYEQAADIAQAGKFGIKPGAGGQAA